MNKKIVALVLVCVLIFSTIVAGTLAFLMDSTETITNTFTFGNVDIELKETSTDNFKLTPGVEYTKDPKVTVKANSEPCYVFVKVEASSNLGNYIDYSINESETAWKKLTGVDGVDNVWYREYDEIVATDDVISVLTGDKVIVKNTITNDNKNDGDQTLAFTAYAIQKDDKSITTPQLAWAELD